MSAYSHTRKALLLCRTPGGPHPMLPSPQSLPTPVAPTHPSPAPQGHPSIPVSGNPVRTHLQKPSRHEAARLFGSVTFLPCRPGCSSLPPGSCPEAAANHGLFIWFCSRAEAPGPRGTAGSERLSPAPSGSPRAASGGQCPYREVRLLQKAPRQAGLGKPPPGSENIASNWVPAHVRAGRTLPRPD